MASALHGLERVVEVVAAGRPNDENLTAGAGVMPALAARLCGALARLIVLREDPKHRRYRPRLERRRWRRRAERPRRPKADLPRGHRLLDAFADVQPVRHAFVGVELTAAPEATPTCADRSSLRLATAASDESR